MLKMFLGGISFTNVLRCLYLNIDGMYFGELIIGD